MAIGLWDHDKIFLMSKCFCQAGLQNWLVLLFEKDYIKIFFDKSSIFQSIKKKKLIALCRIETNILKMTKAIDMILVTCQIETYTRVRYEYRY